MIAQRRTFVRGTLDINALLSFAFGVLFLLIMLGFATQYPNPEPFQIRVFMVALSLAGAGVGAILPGYLDVRYKNTLRAGGALGLFVVIWFFQPVIEKGVVTLETPTQSVESVVQKFFTDLDDGNVEKTFSDLDPATIQTTGITRADWEALYDANLRGLGNVIKRKQMGLNSVISPQGYPIGIYRIINYLTKYANVTGCRAEQLTLRATQDKQWRVYSYLISPNSIECPNTF
jgi:Protein of unknown function (DUF4019)